MDEKIAKLQEATEDAKTKATEAKTALDDSELRLNTAKDLLKQHLDPEEQERIRVGDTMLPELLQMHAIAKQTHEEAETRYNTNLKYLKAFKEKAGMK